MVVGFTIWIIYKLIFLVFIKQAKGLYYLPMSFPLLKYVPQSPVIWLAGICVGSFLYDSAKNVYNSFFFDPTQEVDLGEVVITRDALPDQRVLHIAQTTGIVASKKSVSFNMQYNEANVANSLKFILAPNKRFEKVTGFFSLDWAFQAHLNNPDNELRSNEEVMAILIYYWIQTNCGKEALAYIPQISCKYTIAKISYPDVSNFGQIFNDERLNLKSGHRHIANIEKFILYDSYYYKGILTHSIANEYAYEEISDPYENKQILINLIYKWISAKYESDPYLDIPLLRNHTYILQVIFDNHQNFGELFLEQLDRFRLEN